MIRKLNLIATFVLVVIFQLAHATSPISERIYLMGLKNNSDWVILYKKLSDTNFKEIKTESEPRELYFSVDEGLIFYIDAEYNLRQVTLSDNQQQEKILFKPSENDLYAQPFWDKTKKSLYLVKMPHGKSSEADIVAWKNGKISPVIRQISSQFEPFVDQNNWLYYGHVHCSLACGRIIQEIWRKNLVTGEAGQVSLLGNISRQSIADDKGEWVYFSSNKQGAYHIWKQALNNLKDDVAQAKQITSGNVTDTDPAVSSQNELFFIRHQQGKAILMHLDSDKTLKPITLPQNISEIRNLRINS